jgi:hypothetical protein
MTTGTSQACHNDIGFSTGAIQSAAISSHA